MPIQLPAVTGHGSHCSGPGRFPPECLVIISRHERKRIDICSRIHAPLVKFVIGDVREETHVVDVMKDANY